MSRTSDATFRDLWTQATALGESAGLAARPTPMTVGEIGRDGRLDRSRPTYYVAEGMCGFAWLSFNGNSAFARWLKRCFPDRVHKDYPSGIAYSIWDYNQSIERKEAHARAMAKFLNDHGIACSSRSALD